MFERIKRLRKERRARDDGILEALRRNDAGLQHVSYLTRVSVRMYGNTTRPARAMVVAARELAAALRGTDTPQPHTRRAWCRARRS